MMVAKLMQETRPGGEEHERTQAQQCWRRPCACACNGLREGWTPQRNRCPGEEMDWVNADGIDGMGTNEK